MRGVEAPPFTRGLNFLSPLFLPGSPSGCAFPGIVLRIRLPHSVLLAQPRGSIFLKFLSMPWGLELG